jgi:WD40 repeat protein
VTALAFSPDGKILATGGKDNTVSIWQIADGKELRILGHGTSVGALAFTSDGRMLVAGCDNGTFKLWELATGAEKGTWEGRGSPQRLAFLPDGRLLAELGERDSFKAHLRGWDWKRGALQSDLTVSHTLIPHRAKDLGPAAHVFAVCYDDGSIRLWQAGTGPPRQRTFRLFPRSSLAPTSVAFSPEGRYLAAGNPDGTVCLLRLAERGQVPELPVSRAP